MEMSSTQISDPKVFDPTQPPRDPASAGAELARFLEPFLDPLLLADDAHDATVRGNDRGSPVDGLGRRG